jgi:hypothetical protein
MVACGGGGGTVNSGVPEDKQADELSAQEIQDVCQATADAIDAAVTDDRFCRIAAAMGAAFAGSLGGPTVARTACDSLYEQCLDDPQSVRDQLPADTNLGGASLDCSAAPDSVSNCSVTVGEFETCAGDQIDGITEALDAVPTCDDLTDEQLTGGGDPVFMEPGTPKSCDGLNEADGCSELQIF